MSDVIGEVEFHVPLAQYPMSGSLDPEGFRGLPGELRRLPATTIDSALGEVVADLIKIDVEGFEDKVIAGMTSQLTNGPTVVVECNPDGPYLQVAEVLRKYGYRFRILDGKNCDMTDNIKPDPTEIYRNVLCRRG